jgi:hypothetical protein
MLASKSSGTEANTAFGKISTEDAIDALNAEQVVFWSKMFEWHHSGHESGNSAQWIACNITE